jgi:hypothetical protein
MAVGLFSARGASRSEERRSGYLLAIVQAYPKSADARLEKRILGATPCT